MGETPKKMNTYYIWWGYVKKTICAVLSPSDMRRGQVSDEIAAAVRRVYDGATDEERAICDMVIVRGTHTVVGASLVLHMSDRTATRILSEYVKKTAAAMGLRV